MDAGFGIRFDGDGSSPYLLCADACMVDRRLPEHAWRLCSVGVELIALDDADTILLPSGEAGFVVVIS